MSDTFEFTLNNLITEEQWDQITDVDFERTDRIWFNTKHGKVIEFVKVRHAKLINAHPYGECSICGCLIDSRDHFNYCPNCGARMDS